MVVRSLGLPATGTSGFYDVSPDAWYSGVIETASRYGIVEGVGNNLFAPDKVITREEAMAMIYRASKLTPYVEVSEDNNVSAMFIDYGTQSAWADEAVRFNLNNGLIVGSNETFRPKDAITRAEVSTVVLRLLQKAMLVDIRSKI